MPPRKKEPDHSHAPDQNSERDSDVLTEERIRVKEPSMYEVLLLNDDYTAMDFVTEILQVVFRKSLSEAHTIMMLVHRAGQGCAGVYTKEIAETKIVEVHELARINDYPLRCIMRAV